MAISTPVLTVGPFPVEAMGGNAFTDGTYTGIRSMKIGHGNLISFICIEYDSNGRSVPSEMHGTTHDAQNIDEIILDYPDEFLVSVSGTSTVEIMTKNQVIQTLTIQSNRNIHGPYGMAIEGASSFSTKSTGCKIVGFHGRSGVAMDSIGTYLVPPYKISIGPFGGADGDIFDDGTYPSIKEIEIRHGEGFLTMQTVYVTANAQDHCSSEHGQMSGGKKDHVKLDSDEYLISLSGYHTKGSKQVVQSLTFQSNKKKHGPYGIEEGIPFSTSTIDTSTAAGTGKIVGFHGTIDHECINSIAAYFEPLPLPLPLPLP